MVVPPIGVGGVVLRRRWIVVQHVVGNWDKGDTRRMVVLRKKVGLVIPVWRSWRMSVLWWGWICILISRSICVH
jgi:hypothetical protein